MNEIIGLQGFAVARDERLRLIEEMADESPASGRSSPPGRPDVTEIMVNGPTQIYIEPRGKIQRVDA